MELKLPAPCVVVLIGPSSAGKSTWATDHFAANEVVSSDSLRAVVGIDQDDQQAGAAAFDLLNRIVTERLSRKLTTVIDTTGLNAGNRRRWVAQTHDAGLSCHAILFDTAAELCEQRNAERTRPLPKSVLRKQLARFGTAAIEVETEDFDGVHTRQPVAVVTLEVAATTQEESDLSAPVAHTFGLLLSRFDWPQGNLGEQIGSVAQRAEAAGFRDIWLMDHFRQIPQVGRAWEDLPEAYTTLSYLAGVTDRIRLGALVTGITHRNPVLLGKMVATLDVLSGGRAWCGLGAAWDEDEHTAYGIDFPGLADRYDLLEDTLRMLPLLWGKGSPRFEGKTFSARELVCYPRPIQDRIPILVGGSGEKSTLRLVAEYADACNLFGKPEVIRHKVDVLERHCSKLGRDPTQIEITHLTSVLVAPDRSQLRARVDQLRDRNTSVEKYSARYNAGTVDDQVALFSSYSRSGAQHSMVALPDVALPGSIEAFGDVISAFEES
ncbi:MAG: TIGR03560 family F420-dependent LLM class oxidoreductase [Acidimicrobiia bacterium]